MSDFYGMVVEEVRQLANQLSASASEIRHVVSSLSTQTQNARWTGPDRERFVGDWTGQHVPQLNAVADALEHASQLALQNAMAQEEASTR